MQRGVYNAKASDAVKLAAIHYYVWHGPYDAAKEQFTLPCACPPGCQVSSEWG